MMNPEIVDMLGNKELLKLNKTAFLCSRRIPAGAVLTCYDWAIAERDAGRCVISGFHSRIEKDVFHYLLKGTQPIIMALARGMKTRIEPILKTTIDQGRLLMITPFERNIKWVTTETAEIRNALMINYADEIVIGFASKGGMLERQLGASSDKPVVTLWPKAE
jgi:hypothetical protein